MHKKSFSWKCHNTKHLNAPKKLNVWLLRNEMRRFLSVSERVRLQWSAASVRSWSSQCILSVWSDGSLCARFCDDFRSVWLILRRETLNNAPLKRVIVAELHLWKFDQLSCHVHVMKLHSVIACECQDWDLSKQKRSASLDSRASVAPWRLSAAVVKVCVQWRRPAAFWDKSFAQKHKWMSCSGVIMWFYRSCSVW